MRKLWALATVVFLVLLIACAQNNAYAADMKKANTIDELAKMYDSTACW